MKETQFNFKDIVQANSNYEFDKEKTLIGSIKKVKGHTLFEFNIKTFQLTKAETTQETIVTPTGHRNKTKVIKNDDCMYIQALNFKNAKRKLFNHLTKR